MKALPNSIIGLIEELESLYPPRCIEPTDSRPVADHYAGKSALVVELRNRFDGETKREKNSLPKVLS